MKIYQKIQKLNPHITIPLLLASLLFVISSCSSAAAISTGVTVDACPASITKTISDTGTTLSVSWTPPTATDSNGTSLTADASHSPGDTFPLEATTVTYTFTDDAGNTEICTFTVTVYPASTGVTIAACPADIDMMTAPAGNMVAVTWTEPTAQDSNLNAVTGVQTRSDSASVGDPFPLGETTVTYLFADPQGNDATCTFTVTVSQPASTSVTISDCPVDIMEDIVGVGTTFPITWTPPTAVDSNGNPVITVATYSPDGMYSPGAAFPIGEITVTYPFTDDAGNTASTPCSFTVTVDPAPGAPTISDCPDSFTQETAVAETTVTVTWTEPTAQDSNLNPVTGVQTRSDSASVGDPFPLGPTTVTYLFTDDANLQNSCSFTVTVSQPASTAVTLTSCPLDFTQETAPAGNMVAVTWTPPTAKDSNLNDIIPVASYNPGDSFSRGITVVTYAFTDDANNTDTCSFAVTVSQPASTAVTLTSCPLDFTQETAPAGNMVAVTWTEPTAQDSNLNDIPASGITITITDANTNALPSGDPFPLGVTVVTYTFTDAANNTETCTFMVTVSQPASTFVTISACPADFTQDTRGAMSATVSWTPPTAQDSNLNDIPASGITITITDANTNALPSGDPFPLGVTVVTYTFTDDASPSNTETCTFKVKVSLYAFDRADETADPSATNPFLIETSAELASLASLVNANTTYTISGTASNYRASAYRLENSLDLSTGYTHIPIGTGTSFTGTFDGNGQTLTNLTYNGSHAALGLFSVINGATISDLTLMDPAITNTTTTPTHSTGTLVGTSDKSVISNVSITGGTIKGRNRVGGLVGQQTNGRTITASSASGAVSGMQDVGGLLGYQANGGTITASSASGAVSGTSNVGGLVGLQYSTIKDSSASGAVSGSGKSSANVGGLVGQQFGNTSSITASSASGTVSGYSRVGGLVGQLTSNGTITDSYASGAVSGRYAGGLVGEQNNGKITDSYASGAVSGAAVGASRVGGLVGAQNNGTITNSYASGTVSGASDVGGLVGEQNNGTITNSYASGAVMARSHWAGGLVGRQYSGTITASSASGAVSGTNNIGGIVGEGRRITSSYASGAVSGSGRSFNVGGLVGQLTSNGTITDSYASGAVSGVKKVGGLVGVQASGTITASYWDTLTSGRSSSAGGVGYTTAELQILRDDTDMTNIYFTWNTPPWVFMAGAYPTLSP